VLTLEEVEEELPATGRKMWPCRRRRRRGRARAAAGGARLREDVQDEEGEDAVPFPCSGDVEAGHGDGGEE
jgi:hypothetical protein